MNAARAGSRPPLRPRLTSCSLTSPPTPPRTLPRLLCLLTVRAQQAHHRLLHQGPALLRDHRRRRGRPGRRQPAAQGRQPGLVRQGAQARQGGAFFLSTPGWSMPPAWRHRLCVCWCWCWCRPHAAACPERNGHPPMRSPPRPQTLRTNRQLYTFASEYPGSYMDSSDPAMKVRVCVVGGRRPGWLGAGEVPLGRSPAGCGGPVQALQVPGWRAWCAPDDTSPLLTSAPTHRPCCCTSVAVPTSPQVHSYLYSSKGYKDELAFAAAVLYQVSEQLRSAASDCERLRATARVA